MHSFIPSDSDVINEVRYNKDNTTLYVQFSSGEVYRYPGVSLSRYVFFRDSDSIGDFFNRVIKPNHVAARLPHGFPKAVSRKSATA